MRRFKHTANNRTEGNEKHQIKAPILILFTVVIFIDHIDTPTNESENSGYYQYMTIFENQIIQVLIANINSSALQRKVILLRSF
jgi:hypothetical protein